jgi:cytochrome c oxidase assembly factor CtaG
MNTVTAHWSASWPVLLGYAAIAAVHLIGLGLMLSAGEAPPSQAGGAVADRSDLIRQAGIFQAGLLIAALAIISPFGYWSSVYVWVHAVQDLLLAFIAPALIVLGAPWQPLRRGWSSMRHRPSAAPSPVRPGPAPYRPQRVPWWLSSPVAVVIAFNAIWLGWHLPALFDSTRTRGPAAVAEYITYLAVGIVFWLQLIGSRPSSPAATPLRRFGLIVATVVASTVMGMILVFGAGLAYPAFVGPAHHVLSVLDDQQLAGAVLWMGMLPPMVVVGVAVLLRWFDDEESADLSAGLDRLVSPRKAAWSSRSGRR